MAAPFACEIPLPITQEYGAEHSIELLQALHLLTRDGKLNQDSRRKLKQVSHLYHFVEPLLEEIVATDAEATIADLGAGKSYFGFILYDLFFRRRGRGHVYGIEQRGDLVERSRQLAERLGFARLSFLATSVADAVDSPQLPDRFDLVTALHACDTATDDAIRFALRKQARFMVLVPCCQAEVASVLRRRKNEAFTRTPLTEIWRHPLHTREFGSLVTNALRCLQLEANGYRVSVTELVGWEHSLKNELIIARRSADVRRDAGSRLQRILEALDLNELRPRFLD